MRSMSGPLAFALLAALSAAFGPPIPAAAEERRLEAPAEVEAGETFALRWFGEAAKLDLVTIVPAGTPEGRYEGYDYPSKRGNPMELHAPERSGVYEIRWLAGSTPYPTLARTTLRVRAVEAGLEAPASVEAGAKLAVRWTGPGRPLDFVALVPAGAPEGTAGNHAYTKRGNPLELTAPETAGAHELRYVTGREKHTLVSVPLAVGGATASVAPPAEVLGGADFELLWTGPAHELDYLAITTTEDPDTSLAYTYARRGNPALLEAPKTAGEYFVHYVTGRERRRLATAALRVAAAPIPGRLEVTAEGLRPWAQGSAVELILDASGSMLQRLDGRRRIEIARDSLVQLVQETIPEGTLFALRVFGHREPDSCRTDLEMPLAPLDRDRAVAVLRGVEAMNLARTPLGRSLELVPDDLAAATGERIVLVVTDGEETCDGDPRAAIEALRAGGLDARVTIVGFAIDEQGLRRSFEEWARVGGGTYVDAPDAEGLARGLRHAVRVPFRVLDASGAVVATGVVGGEPVELPVGRYRVEAEHAGRTLRGEVELPAGQLTGLRLE